MVTAEALRITEIFHSIQGESTTSGLPTVFIRLTGCPLRCSYCDTDYAFYGGERWTIDKIIDEVRAYDTPWVTVTGGEPLAQPNCLILLQRLVDADYRVSLETSGALDISAVPAGVMRVMDLKTPASGEQERNRLSNLQHLNAHDQVKFVIASEADYQWARDMLREHRIDERCEILLSPVAGDFDASVLADSILKDRLPVRLQVQLHKILWGDQPGR